MGMLHQVEQWGTSHHPKWLVGLRVALGICLFIKGIGFISNTVSLEALLSGTNVTQHFPWLAQLITWAHLFGGCMIIIGLLTRLAALLQVPILIGALFLNAGNGIFTSQSEFGFSLIIFLLLILFLIEGGGPLSLDNYFKKNLHEH